MTREEAIQWLTDIKENITENWSHDVAIDMAIEALQEPKTIIGIDIPYGSDKGIATIFKGNDKMVLEEVKEIMSVVRCKDCKWYISQEPYDNSGKCTYRMREFLYCRENDFCSYGERREE